MANEYTPVLSSVKLPSGTVYYFKDTWAREQIEQIISYTGYIGVTTTPLTDGSTTNPIIINGQPVTAASGNITIYGQKEFIFNGSAWQEFGDLSAIIDLLGRFAYVDEGETTIKPKGSVDASFIGNEGSIDITYTPSGSIEATFTGENGTVNVTGIPNGIIQFAEIVKSATGNYQPTGTIENTISVSTPTISINYITNDGTLPSLTLSALNAGIDQTDAEQLSLYFDPTLISWNPGTLPTTSTVNVVTDVDVDVDSTFVGDSVSIAATFSGSSTTFSGSFTPSGSISATFSGTEANISTSFTPSGSISATFSGTEETYIVTPKESGGEG